MNRPHRILVVDDEPYMRQCNAKMLTDAGYHVDAAENGAVAWNTLQEESYDLLITDNNMPKVTGVELIKKIRAAGMALPIIMATAVLPWEAFICRPQLQPAATLIKPYTHENLLGTVRKVLCATLTMAVLPLCVPATTQGQEVKQTTGLQLPPADAVERLTAMTLSARGPCEYSEKGAAFTKLKHTDILQQGDIVRTGENAHADLFFRRTGVTIRVQAGTEMKIEKMTATIKDGLPIVDTLLDLRSGRIFTVVRSTVGGSVLEIRNAAGRSVVQGSGVGRYIITADGTHVSAEGSVIPLKVIGENGITIIAAGEQFDRKDGKILPRSANSWVKELIELDELDAATAKLALEKSSP
jgi:CheY-like chemotaxis protein